MSNALETWLSMWAGRLLTTSVNFFRLSAHLSIFFSKEWDLLNKDLWVRHHMHHMRHIQLYPFEYWSSHRCFVLLCSLELKRVPQTFWWRLVIYDICEDAAISHLACLAWVVEPTLRHSQGWVIDLGWGQVEEGVVDEEEKEEDSDQVAPNVEGLIMDHEETPKDATSIIEVDTIASQDILVVMHEFWGLILGANEESLVFRVPAACLGPFNGWFPFLVRWICCYWLNIWWSSYH